jgi:hypothetical protein
LAATRRKAAIGGGVHAALFADRALSSRSPKHMTRLHAQTVLVEKASSNRDGVKPWRILPRYASASEKNVTIQSRSGLVYGRLV